VINRAPRLENTATGRRRHLFHEIHKYGGTGLEVRARGHMVKSFLNNNRGFTLIELLVVMVIIGLLTGIVGPKLFKQMGKSEVKTAHAQIDALEKAIDTYRIDTGHYPTTEQGLSALMVQPANESKWAGPYLKKSVPLDPWGKPYIYKQPGEHGDYDIFSYGKDGQLGGTDESADITNW
jgi:general secretion pathway protein G